MASASEQLRQAGVMLVVSGGIDEAVEAATLAAGAGIRAVEVRDSSYRLQMLRAITEAQVDVLPGAGGISAAGDVWPALEAGAKFVSSASLSSEVAAVCEAAGAAVVADVPEPGGAGEVLHLRPDFLRMPYSDEAREYARSSQLPVFLDIHAGPEVEALLRESLPNVLLSLHTGPLYGSLDLLAESLRSVMVRLGRLE